MQDTFAGLTEGEWTAVGTVATALIALGAAIFALLQVRELRRTREEQARPFVVVDIQPGKAWSNLLDLIVENIGTTVAHNVQITFEPPLLQSKDDGYPIGESVLLTEGVAMLPPGRRIRAFFDVSHERSKSDLPMRYDVTVTLRDARGRKQPDQRYVIDLRYLYGLTEIREYGLHDAAKSIREIEKRVQKWADVTGRLRVWVRDEDQKDLEDRIEHELTGHYPSLGRSRPSDLLMTMGRYVLFRIAFRWWRERRR